MSYTVVWLPDAERELAELWLAADVREGVTLAADQIDRQLQHDPDNVGESRANNRRIVSWLHWPLLTAYCLSIGLCKWSTFGTSIPNNPK